jgi:hypothetical protein
VSDPREGITPSPCPSCGQPLNAAVAPDTPEARPQPGDLSMCLCCAAFVFFNDDMTLRAATDEELDDLAANPPELHRQMRAWATRAWGERN